MNNSFLEGKETFSVTIQEKKFFGLSSRERVYNLVVATPEQIGVQISLRYLSCITVDLYGRAAEKGLGTIPEAVVAAFESQNHQGYGGDWDGSFLIPAVSPEEWDRRYNQSLLPSLCGEDLSKSLRENPVFVPHSKGEISPESRWLWAIVEISK